MCHDLGPWIEFPFFGRIHGVPLVVLLAHWQFCRMCLASAPLAVVGRMEQPPLEEHGPVYLIESECRVSPDMVQGGLHRALLWLALMLVEIGLKLEFRHIGIEQKLLPRTEG